MLIILRNDDQQMLLSCDNCTGNSRFSGFAIDLLTAISKVGQVFFNSDIVVVLLPQVSIVVFIQVADFTFTLYRVPDNIYGVFDHQTKVKSLILIN